MTHLPSRSLEEESCAWGKITKRTPSAEDMQTRTITTTSPTLQHHHAQATTVTATAGADVPTTS